MKTLLAALTLTALPLAALAQPIVVTTNDPAMAAAMGEVIRLNGQALGAGGGTGAHVGQQGHNNAAGVGQTGPNNQAVIVQHGCNNNATTVQSGQNLHSGTFQFACGGQAHVTQTGSNQATVVVEWGPTPGGRPPAGRRR